MKSANPQNQPQSDIRQTKMCNYCHTEKPLEEMCKSKNTPDGRVNRCTLCDRERSKRYYAAHSEKMVRQNAAYVQTERGRKAQSISNKRSKARHPGKQNARARLLYAIKVGKIIRPEKCDRCDWVGRIEAHHTDYSKPYEVDWLCTVCHKAAHNRLTPNYFSLHRERSKA